MASTFEHEERPATEEGLRLYSPEHRHAESQRVPGTISMRRHAIWLAIVGAGAFGLGQTTSQLRMEEQIQVVQQEAMKHADIMRCEQCAFVKSMLDDIHLEIVAYEKIRRLPNQDHIAEWEMRIGICMNKIDGLRSLGMSDQVQSTAVFCEQVSGLVKAIKTQRVELEKKVEEPSFRST